MTTQPTRLTAEEEAREIAIAFAMFPDGRVVYGPVWCEKITAAIADTLRQRDELWKWLYAKAWAECEDARPGGQLWRYGLSKMAHDAARKAAGLEDA